jgi:hypothetical protein
VASGRARMKRGLLPMAAVVLALGSAGAEESWDGTWSSGVAPNWSPVRLYFAGNRLIGFYLNGDYLADTQGSLSASDGVVTITWTRGQAILTRDGANAAHLWIVQKGKGEVILSLIGEP